MLPWWYSRGFYLLNLRWFQMSRRCTTVKDVPADQFIKKCADFLKRQPKFQVHCLSGSVSGPAHQRLAQVPKWADLVKTGHFKELAPYDEVCTHTPPSHSPDCLVDRAIE